MHFGASDKGQLGMTADRTNQTIMARCSRLHVLCLHVDLLLMPAFELHKKRTIGKFQEKETSPGSPRWEAADQTGHDTAISGFWIGIMDFLPARETMLRFTPLQSSHRARQRHQRRR